MIEKNSEERPAMAKPTPASSVLFVDDIAALRDQMRRTLVQAGIECETIDKPSLAVSRIESGSFALVITTLVMQEMNGFDLIRAIRGSGSDIPIMMITGYGTEQSAIEAARLGVCDYLTKPIDDREVVARVERVLKMRAECDNVQSFRLEKMISSDPTMMEVFEKVKTVAPSASRVLILGETGSGKQLLAHAIHAQSPRRESPFIEVNCAAIPSSLIESELFGHEAGAFTGATSKRIGRFEAAGDGTIFLDEIGELNFDLQSKLLHVLQDGHFVRVGGNRTLTSRARLISATNRNLHEEVEHGRFRADLFYRLNVISIELPPLRERSADVPVLAEYFLGKFVTEGRRLPKFSRSALEVLSGYSWPGNVRELQNLAEQLAVLHSGDRIEATDLPSRIVQRSWASPLDAGQVSTGQLEADGKLAATKLGEFDLPVNMGRSPGGKFEKIASDSTDPGTGVSLESMKALPLREARAQFERFYLADAIARADGNLARASRLAQLDRGQFYRLAKKHGLTEENS